MASSFTPSQTPMSLNLGLLASSPVSLNYASPAPTIIPISNISTDVSPLRWFLVEVVHTADTEESLKRWSSFIGICIAISGNVLISLALNVQKYAHTRIEREAERKRAGRLKKLRMQYNGDLESPPLQSGEGDVDVLILHGAHASPRDSTEQNGDIVDETSRLLPSEKEDEDDDKTYIASPYWWAGLVMMFFGECGNFLAYGFAPASIVSPLGVVALVSNCVIAPVMLKEPFRARDVMGVLVSIAGAVTVVWSAEKEEAKLGPGEILNAISQTAFEVYFGITSAMILGLMYCSRKYGHKNICVDLGLVALLGGYTVLSTKGISSLISSSFYHIFQYPIAYLFTFVLASTAILQIKYVNRALQCFDSTQVIPTQFVLFTLSVILGSAILYRDFETVSQQRLLKFVSGCGLTFIGVYLISSQRDGKERANDDDFMHLYDAAGVPAQPIYTRASLDAHFAGLSSSTIPSSSSSYANRPGLYRNSSQLSSNAVSLVSTPALSTSPTAVNPYLPETPPPQRKRPSESGAPVNIIPGVMAGYQLGGVIKSRSMRGKGRRTDENASASAAEDDGGRVERTRSGSLSVVLDFVTGKNKDSISSEQQQGGP